MPRALLIDDESPARAVLRAMLADHSDMVVVGEAATLAEARVALARSDYDLVFLDIQLIGGSGFDLVPLVAPEARIVFVTAFDRHALRAFEVNALDYLVKPVAPERLANALARVAPGAATATSATSRPLRIDDRVLLKLGAGSEHFVRLADIRFVASSENYSEIAVGAAGERLMVRRTMKAWEDVLPPEYFVRVHRQMIVNAAHVRGLDRASEATLLVHLDGVPEPISASYRYVAALRDRLQDLSRPS